MNKKRSKTSVRNIPHAHVIALHVDNKITYHYVESQKDEDKLIGQIVGRYTASKYLANEKRIQTYHNLQLKSKGVENETL